MQIEASAVFLILQHDFKKIAFYGDKDQESEWNF